MSFRVTQVDIRPVEGPLGDGLDLDVEVGVQGVDALGEVEVDDHPVVQGEGAAEGVERDLETAVEVASIRSLEVEGQVDAEVGALERRFDLRRHDAVSARPVDELGDVAVERLRRLAQHTPLADRDVLVVDARRQR